MILTLPLLPRPPFARGADHPGIINRHFGTGAEQVWNRQKGGCLFHFFSNIIELSTDGTGGTGENRLIAYVRAHARARRIPILTFIWIIIKSACSTCSLIEIIELSPVPTACSYLFRLFQKRRVGNAK